MYCNENNKNNNNNGDNNDIIYLDITISESKGNRPSASGSKI